MLGEVSDENVRDYMRLNSNERLLKILAFLGKDLPTVLTISSEITESLSPSVTYERLAEASLLAYRTWLGVGKPPSFWNGPMLTMIGQLHQEHLLRFADVFSERLAQPTQAMLDCDLASLHHVRAGTWSSPVHTERFTNIGQTLAAAAPAMVQGPRPQAPAAPPAAEPAIVTAPLASSNPTTPDAGRVTPTPPPSVPPPAAPVEPAKSYTTKSGVYVDPRGLPRKETGVEAQRNGTLHPLEPAEFGRYLQRHVAELLNGQHGRSSGHT